MDFARMSLAEIRAFLARRKRIPSRQLDSLSHDPRTGVRRLLANWKKRRENELNERRRMRGLTALERRLWSEGLSLVAGVDEVGVGPLAGPVVAAAVIFAPGTEIPEIDDSKKLKGDVRLRLESRIRSTALEIGIGIADVPEIDRLNVYHAALQAMRRAVLELSRKPEHVLVDAREIPDLEIPQQPIPGGDGRHFSIAAASIIAKTHRDRLMKALDRRFPQYGFSTHKGYCTPEHQAAIRRHGACPIHRRSYTFVQELTGEASPAYLELKARLDAENSVRELASIRRDIRADSDLSPQERRKLQQLLARRQKRYPGPSQLRLL